MRRRAVGSAARFWVTLAAVTAVSSSCDAHPDMANDQGGVNDISSEGDFSPGSGDTTAAADDDRYAASETDELEESRSEVGIRPIEDLDIEPDSDADEGLNRDAVTVTGRVRYQDMVYGPGGFTGEVVKSPFVSGVVELWEVGGGAPISEARTDTNGRFLLSTALEVEAEVFVRARAAVVESGLRAEVRDRSGDVAIYAIDSATFTLRPAAHAEDIELLGAFDEPIGGAMNIADALGVGLRFVRRYSDRPAPTLRVHWERGLNYSCGSCYLDNIIRLGGRSDDPDEYDDDIILHELGHFITEHFGRDTSPGGAHRDRLVGPELAWGEGLAYFLSSAIRSDPTMVDNYETSHRFIDYEAVTLDGEELPTFFGTTDGTFRGRLREEIVAAIIWDVYDDSPDEPFDRISLGMERTIRLLFDYFRDGPPVDVGVPGVDLPDFLNAVACTYPEMRAELQAVIDNRGFPWDVAVDSRCDW